MLEASHCTADAHVLTRPLGLALMYLAASSLHQNSLLAVDEVALICVQRTDSTKLDAARIALVLSSRREVSLAGEPGGEVSIRAATTFADRFKLT